MSVLNDEEIERYCKEYQLIKPYDINKIKYASYDLSVGEEYRITSEEKVRKIGKNGIIEIPPNELCYILTEETLNLPVDMCAFTFPRQTRILEGVLMYPQPPIDPGYKGKLYVLLHNLSNQKIPPIRKGDHLATMVFLKLVDESAGYGSDKEEDKYFEAISLEGLRANIVYKGGLKELRDEMDKVKEEVSSLKESFVSKYLPAMLVIVSIIIMILTIIIGFIIGFGMIN
jgi:deoxycytidine triphosphate deaminase